MRPRRILLTGASGLLGGELAGRLLDAGHAVTGLVNRTPTVTRNDGTVIPVIPWSEGSPPEAGRCRTLAADISAPRLGLDDRAFGALAATHDLLLHAAALTRFDAEDAEYRRVNIDGTSRVLELAHAGAMDLLHVSTAYVCGTREGPILETELGKDQGFANGYERSKAAAELLVRRSGLRAVIARPSIIVGDHAEGRVRRFDTFYVVLKLLAEGRLPVIPAEPEAALDLVPLDHVVRGLSRCVERFDAAAGRTLHLVADRPTPTAAFPETIGRHPGLSVPAMVPPARFDPGALSPNQRRFFDRGLGVYVGYFSRTPRFDDRDARAVLDLAPPPVDAAWWDRLVAHALAEGFIRAGRPAVPGR